jgi:hypothetical protein
MLCQPGRASFPLASVDDGNNRLVIVITRAIVSGHAAFRSTPSRARSVMVSSASP